jgi:hypothetical protein
MINSFSNLFYLVFMMILNFAWLAITTRICKYKFKLIINLEQLNINHVKK